MTHDPLLDADVPGIFAFIRAHDTQDVTALGLKPMPDENWPRTAILDQIAARQKARAKMPDWLEETDIVLPATDVIEQASSPATARYKAGLTKPRGRAFADITAGAGVDTAALAPHFQHGICVEADGVTARRLRSNLGCFFGQNAPAVRHSTAEDALDNLPPCDLVFVDPQRRSDQGRVKGFKGSQPDITDLLPQLLDKSECVLIKASPMLDIASGCDQLSNVAHVHIVEYAGAVRELLFDCRRDATQDSIYVHAVVIDDTGHVQKSLEADWPETSANPAYADPARYIYEPAPAVMKSRLFASISAQHKLAKLAPATHLFTADHYDATFPGHIYEIQDILPVDRRALKRAGIHRANLKCRNFPETPERLQTRLRLRDGGEEYLFACQLADGHYRLVHGRFSR
jgi:hypothetical protein